MMPPELLQARFDFLQVLKKCAGGCLCCKTTYFDKDKGKESTVYPSIVEEMTDIDALLLAHLSDPSTTANPRVVCKRKDGKGYYSRHLRRKNGERLFIESINVETRQGCFGLIDVDGDGHAVPVDDPLSVARQIVQNASAVGIDVLMLRSNGGTGYHIYFFLRWPASDTEIYHVLKSFIPEAYREQIEVFPKPPKHQRRRSLLVSVPWFGGSKAGCNEFLDPETLEIIELPKISFVDDMTFRRALALAPKDTVTDTKPLTTPCASDARRTSSRTRQQHHDTAMASWFDQVKADPRLHDEVYGPYRRGKQSPHDEWETILDPWAPDRNWGRAGFNTRTGVYHCFAASTGCTLSIFEFMIETGQATDMKDAMRRAAEVTGIPLPVSTRRSRRVKYGRTIPTTDIAPLSPEGTDLKTARDQLRYLLFDTIPRAFREEKFGVDVVGAGTGIGKTFLIVYALLHDLFLTKSGRSVRTLFLVKTRALLEELVRRFSDARGNLPDDVMIAHPRSGNPKDPGFCYEFSLVEHIGQARHVIAKSFCPSCKQRRAEVLRCDPKAVPDCPYIAQKKALKDARIVLATHDAYLHGGKEIRDFKIVILDEDVQDALVETLMIRQTHVLEWQTVAERYDPGFLGEIAPFFSTLLRVFTAGAFSGITVDANGMFLLHTLRELDNDIDEKLARAYSSIKTRLTNKQGTTPADTLHPYDLFRGMHAPLRALGDLVQLLAEEAQCGRPVATGAWLIGHTQSANEEPIPHYLKLVLPRWGLIELLKQRMVICLDATPNMTLLNALFGNTTLHDGCQAAIHAHTTFFADSLFRNLTVNSWTRRALDQVIATLCARHRHPLLVVPKAMNPRVQGTSADSFSIPSNASVIHHGSSESRGSNAFEGCDAILVIGHFRVPDAEFAHLAFAMVRPQVLLTGTQLSQDFTPHAREKLTVGLPGFRDSQGYGATVKISYPADELAQQLARHKYQADLLQTLGRLRMSQPRDHGGPAAVYLFVGEPVPDFPIHAVTTLATFLAKECPEWLEANPLLSQLGGSATTKTLQVFQDANQQRSTVTFEKCLAAAKRIRDRGELLTRKGLGREAGVALNSVKRYFEMVQASILVGDHADPIEKNPYTIGVTPQTLPSPAIDDPPQGWSPPTAPAGIDIADLFDDGSAADSADDEGSDEAVSADEDADPWYARQALVDSMPFGFEHHHDWLCEIRRELEELGVCS